MKKRNCKRLVLIRRATKVFVTKENTTIVEGVGDSAQIAGSVNQIHTRLEKTTFDFDRENIQERLAKFAGGDTALVNIYNKVASIQADGDEQTGINIVLRAIEEPVRQIAHNAGLEGSVIVERLKHEQVGVGFNAATGEWVNMVEAGIVDPTKVTCSTLQNAGSVAAMFLTT